MRNHRRTARQPFTAIGLGILLALASAPGCTSDRVFDEPEDPPGRYLARTSPGNVLHNIEQAFRYRDLEGYRAQLHEQFVYEGRPGATDFPQFAVEAVEKLFLNMDGVEIALAFPDGDVASTVPEYPASEGYRMIDAPSVRMDLGTRQFIGGEPLIYQVGPKRFAFVFAPDPGAETWRLIFARHEGD